MLLSFDKCIEAIAETLITREFPSARQAEKSRDIAAFLLDVHSKMPDYLRLSFRILTLVFDAWPYPMLGKPFHQLSLARRSAQLDRWEHSRLQSRHGLIAFYRTLAIFGLYSELYKQDDGA